MKLYIDTSSSETIKIGVGEKLIEKDAFRLKAQLLLGLISEELRLQNKEIADITEIEINLGPGSFTGLRVGVAVANTLSWTLGIPVNGLTNVVPQY